MSCSRFESAGPTWALSFEGAQECQPAIAFVFKMIESLQVPPGLGFVEASLTITRFHLLHRGHAIAATDLKDLRFCLAQLSLQECAQPLLNA